MVYTDDPIRDFENCEREIQRRLQTLPLCECCEEPIQQERAVYYNGQWVCEECESDFWRDIREDFLEDVS